ncbi:MAG TPA: response regulator [Thermoguttaceae bacterium]|nr:response regulator [Thermoguttaceae bacterium]
MLLRTPPSDWSDGAGAMGFAVDEATSAEQARQRLDQAFRDKRPYDVILLDMQLPATERDAEDDKAFEEAGRKLLTDIRASCDTAVVVLTGFPSPQNFIHAVREGAADFLAKPLASREDEKMLFTRLVIAVGRTREAVHRKLRLQRLLWLKDHDRRSDHERFAKLVSEAMGRISDELHGLAETLSRRYGLDPNRDAEDPVCRHVAAVEEMGNDLARTICKSIEQEEPARFEKVDVAATMTEQIARARPCYLHRGVRLEWTPSEAELQTKTFPEDLRLMVAELILGTLELAASESTVQLSSQRSEDGRDIVISATRSGKRVPKEVQKLLREGRWVRTQGNSDWQGLSFLQRIANNIGARLDIKSSDERTVVSLRIPIIGDG